MEGVPVNPKEILKGVEVLLGKDGGLCSLEGVPKMFSLMKASTKMVSRCMYLNILLHTKSHDVLNRYIRVGGYRLLNSWLTYSKTTNNSPLLQLILLTLQKLPLKVDHLKENNTAKLVKQLSKCADTEELRKLASVLVEGWMATIRSQSVSSSANSPADKKKKKKEDAKVPLRDVKDKSGDEEKKKDKAKAHAPSHAKIRSIGLEMDTPSPVPTKKPPVAPQLGDKYNIKPPLLKRLSCGPFDTPPLEKKYKPLNMPSNAAKEIKVKIIPAQPMECTGFLDALNSAPVPGIKIKKKKAAAGSPSSAKAVSPTSNKASPFEGKPSTYSSTSVKPPSPEAASSNNPEENQQPERPGTPVPTEDPDSMDTGDKPNALSEPRGEEDLTKKGKKKKTVHWAHEDHLKHYYYFDLDETERVNVNKIKDFGEAAKRELMMDRHTFEMARRLSHDTMEERVPWAPPRPLTLPGSLVNPGANSTEKLTQRDREMGILQEIFLSKDSVPDSPHEPDPEPYEPMPPRLIPLDEDSSMDDGYADPMDTTSQQVPSMVHNEGSKLPPVLANLIGNLNSSCSPQNTNTVNNAVAPAVNVQELLTSIMGASGNQSTEDLIKQPDFSDKIKQLLGSLQQNQNQGPPPVNMGMPGHGPGMNNMHMQMPMNGGFPPNMPPGGPRFSHPPPPHNHGPPFNSGGGPRMMGPPPGQGRGDNGNYWGDDSMRGGPHRGGPFLRGGRGRGGEPGFRGRGRGGPRGAHNNMNDMSNRPICRHFMMKGNCRYESNCAFYHPGVNGPPLPPNHHANNH
ncbi:serine/threonine-protein phosphatase 1 regulatory subunit 10-like [Entelurus aequoreus]|uniref:serine/threonine-protein phosphatase 1 regulatory subunit 10-like n=1 Tax=Entelurus aequoreus TaxID=161455 RepID=UPI002B1E29DF|nr:serine/threonine-protein phosphatase 1 regulatory subunit 10-like [Entelurus aequoreus]XP_061912696.1 serine/threonine-protein phosphatase 1 regulatory subunit 10-like [Entelurus aequoreus]XP_061912728.1 serine/threonine-protein phosphatase 1 regulatory subunit 10-like [Entelurus aequoreus]XP_061912729.1 serine/threonine-protein phosphatase 1 regulatory subunit 10-like [Entelurus aequoreus]XP_061912730.1 serine/threonine-protein phosphatase 1 regulatory subunit 10-like [Entelurus aequoreus]